MRLSPEITDSISAESPPETVSGQKKSPCKLFAHKGLMHAREDPNL